MTCTECGTELQIGMYPFCAGDPAGHGSPVRGRSGDVTWPGGRTFENLANEPKTFYSPAELNRYLKAHNLEPMVRHQPVPGTDKSPHTSSWAAVSQETLDGAKAMLERVNTGGKSERPTLIESFSVTVTDVPGYVTRPIAGVHAD